MAVHQGVEMGTSVGRYVVGPRLGTGGMGVVYEAATADGSRVALKLIHRAGRRDPYRLQRFREEGEAGTMIRHPGVVAVLERGETADGAPFLVMELVGGESLLRWIERCELSLEDALDLGGQLLDALAAMHAAGVVHGDVKSDNILVERRGDQLVLVLIDLGLARLWRKSGGVPHAGVVSGTPDYMAPELIRGEPPTPSSDGYAASVVIYEMITGSRPFGGGTPADIIVRHLEEPPVAPSQRAGLEFSCALDRVVLLGLAKHPRDRHASAASFAEALREAGRTLGCACRDRSCGTPRVAFSCEAPTVEI